MSRVAVAAVGLSIALVVGGAVVANLPSVKFRSERSFVAHLLKDPDTAQFSDERISPSGTHYCARVNSKNSYGAYGGFRRVVADSKCFVYLEQEGYRLTSQGSECRGAASYDSVIDLAIYAHVLRAKNDLLEMQLKLDAGGSADTAPKYDDHAVREAAKQKSFDDFWNEKCA